MKMPSGKYMGIAVRAHVRKSESNEGVNKAAIPVKTKRRVSKPSEWSVIFDTETTTDATQELRFGTYQVRKGAELVETGVFYNPAILSDKEQVTLKAHAEKRGLAFITVKEFIENIFYGVGYQYRATIVGFNLPFDISRLASEHSTARASRWNKVMRGGFSFKLSENEFHPRVQIKHVSSRDSFIQFAATKGQRATRSDRKKGRMQPVRRGFFIDIKTLAAALTSKSHSLSSLATYLGVAAQKHETEGHGRVLTPEYIAYAEQDTQTTWECYCALKALYAAHDLKLTAAHNIHSEASLGKAYLRDMGLKSWRQVQPDFPPEITGHIMSAYFGGRSEVHIRKEITQVLYCDFLSMYPTVCTLMNLWEFVKAQGKAWRDTTDETRKLLDGISVSDLQLQKTWKNLATIVEVIPDGEIFPVRAKYEGDSQYTIGSNHLTSDMPLFFTLADCISAKLLTGRAPKILRAISFAPMPPQEGLQPVDINGNPSYRVDPYEGDLFKRLIDMRSMVKQEIKSAKPSEKSTLESQQLTLKILANATSYGIFVELNVEEEKQPQKILCYGTGAKPFPLNIKKFEEAGTFFHPLLAALITGAARLMLAATERLAIDAGLDWAFCDTDSMALAKPEGMAHEDFYNKAKEVQEWFTPLNPYAQKAPLLKVEDYNFSLVDKTLEPLYCYAISSKRYALFNLDAQGKVILRKVSAHGLGHLMPPYTRKDDSCLEDAQPWQQDLWLEIINAAIEEKQPDFSKLENFNMPAISRYGATTPPLLKWFETYNDGKPYSEQVRPFNFLNAMQAKHEFKHLKPVSPFNKSPANAVTNCFDRATGQPIKRQHLKTYLDSLNQYHLHPESKFLNGDFLDSEKTQRRHIIVKSINYIGKEANKWEEQFLLGFDPDAQIEYGISPEQKNVILQAVAQAVEQHGAQVIAEASKLSARHIIGIVSGKKYPSEKALAKLYTAIKNLEADAMVDNELRQKIKALMQEKKISIRTMAEYLSMDASNLAKVLSGKRKAGNFLILAYGYFNRIVFT